MPTRQLHSKNRRSHREIFFNKLPCLNTEASDFHGICVDTGAEQSVAGLTQTKVYFKMACKARERAPSNPFFKLGDTIYPSIGCIPIRIPTPRGGTMEFNLVVEANVPIPLGLDLLDNEELYIDNIDNVIVHKHQGWTIPLQRNRGHLYITCT